MILSTPTEARDILILAPICVVCMTASRLFVSEEEFEDVYAGKAKSEVFSDLPPEEVEVLISGTHPECWNELFKEEK